MAAKEQKSLDIRKKDFALDAERPDRIEARVAAEKLDLSDLTGTWLACDRNTGNLVRVDIGTRGSSLTVHAFGACTPSPCDWGTVKGIAYAANVSSAQAIAFSARYEFSFKNAIVTGHLDSGSLVVETYNEFTDGSGRSNYYTRGYYCRRKRG